VQIRESVPASERGLLFTGSRKANDAVVEIDLDDLEEVKDEFRDTTSLADMSLDSPDVSELTEKLASSVQVAAVVA
jgi:hypothetical protein